MAMGIPVIHGVAGESAEIVEREGVGVLFEPENDAQLGERLRALQADPNRHQTLRQNGPAAARHYQRADLAMRMMGILEQILAR